MPHQHSAASPSWLYPYDLHRLYLADHLHVAFVAEGHYGEQLLFIHGLGGDHRHWTKNIEILNTTHRCLAVDLPGHGHSAKEQYPYSIHFFVQVLRAFLGQKNLEKVCLIGHSMGAQIAIQLALHHPSLVSRLILVAPAGLEHFTPWEKMWLKNLSSPTALKTGALDHLLHSFENNFYRSRPEAKLLLDPELLNGNLEVLEKYSELMSQCVQAMLDESVFERLHLLSMPVDIIFGENDFLIPNKLIHPSFTTRLLAENAVHKIPHGQLFIIPQAGHFVNWEKADEVNEIILNALAE